MLFHPQNRASVFWNLNFLPKYLGKGSLCSQNQPCFLRNSDKSLLSPEQNKLKEIWHIVLQTKNSWRRQCQNKCFPKYVLYLFALQSQRISSNFLSEKIEVLTTSVFLNSKCVIFLYLLTYLFVSLNENIH